MTVKPEAVAAEVLLQAGLSRRVYAHRNSAPCARPNEVPKGHTLGDPDVIHPRLTVYAAGETFSVAGGATLEAEALV